MFAQAVSLWRNMVANGASLDYPSAAEMIQNSEAMSKAFLQACQQVGGGLCWAASGNSMQGYINCRAVRRVPLCVHSLTGTTCHHRGRQPHAAACRMCVCAWSDAAHANVLGLLLSACCRCLWTCNRTTVPHAAKGFLGSWCS